MSWRSGPARRASANPEAQLQFEFIECTAIKTKPASAQFQNCGRDTALEQKACELLHSLDAGQIANGVRVKWNPRLTSCAGRADFRTKLIYLNPQLHAHPNEIERTFLHELAHLLAQFRAGRKRILPHGKEWRQACVDLGIGDEKRCHNLPFPILERARKFLYQCPHCREKFPRVRKIRRAIACLACCRAHNSGDFDPRFQLRFVTAT